MGQGRSIIGILLNHQGYVPHSNLNASSINQIQRHLSNFRSQCRRDYFLLQTFLLVRTETSMDLDMYLALL